MTLRNVVALSLALTACGPLAVPGVGSEPDVVVVEDHAFSLYLAADPEARADLLDQGDRDSLELEAEPLLTVAEISAYRWSEHSFSLAPGAEVALPEPGVFGIPFVIVSGGERQYLGAFWTLLSSVAWFEPTILVGPGVPADPLTIERGYPGGGDEPPDPRDNATIEEALRRAGKLVE